jgi:hypothetical protein
MESYRLNRRASARRERVSSAVSGMAQILSAQALLCCLVLAASPGSNRAQETPNPRGSHAMQQETQPRCQIAGAREIAIACVYTSLPAYPAHAGKPQIALNHAEFSFKTVDENWMRLKLAFIKLASAGINENRQVYIEVDDDSGHNFIRRPLPSVNLTGLSPGHLTEFNERILVPALRPGRYQIKLWIPSTDPALEFNAAHNLLVRSVGVADGKSGLNSIASFSVVR